MKATKTNEERLLAMATKIKDTFQPSEIAQLMRLIGATPSTGEMSPVEFERLMQELEVKNNRRGYSPKSIEAAHLVLVMGASITEAALDTNLSRQSVNQLMVRIRRRMESLPQGWRQVTEWFPAEVAAQIENLAASLKAVQVTGKPLDAAVFNVTLAQA
ncbi:MULTISPECIES: TrfB-related DNA-binding protein [unclassified Pseudomonas]|uniref:TrfB-related DNA-binding protein n=1 Tax=unclassified Pseudomonas TaxID=196821 RepID=UPI002AB4747D|nr:MULTISPECIES: TrfB-related DNA-binding protein [unclassified Pseudomonas]MDY7563446.1 TrfB-related DNA-binding protein [Pseudomonas sp. AB6]MEA9979901.1 TrfB-related DNA-binding protein [Pseudomonas sp. RTS4]MEB0198186.1 TrfB-related DNA-binding protein [Pseudomonas sp. 5S4]MEB0213381.1 TrfB-related DNA-binding protein [Pseudomonas sp. AB6]MEB0247825.1 TrfB-related DNA-binding protein [Pseudomonas sp. 10S5]